MDYNVQRKDNNERNCSIDFIKGICIIFVIITHYSWTNYERLVYLFPYWIEMAVPVFMIISGYVYAKSYNKRVYNSFFDAYNRHNITFKMIRYLIPYIIVFIIMFSLLYFKKVMSFSLFKVILLFLTGGYGPGSYYVPIMIQFVLIYPIIYFLIRKYDKYGVLIIFLMNLAYEVIKTIVGVGPDIYRLLIFRYLFMISFGCYLAMNQQKINKIIYYLCFVLGVVFIFLFNYVGWTPKFLSYWTSTSFLACLYIIPISEYLVTYSKLKNKVIELIGKASYNIFLFQMLYYNMDCNLYINFKNNFIELIFNILFCILMGIAFYYMENPITKRIIKKVKNH